MTTSMSSNDQAASKIRRVDLRDLERDEHGASEETVREFCRGRIAHYKIPRYVRFVESFPTTVTGKMQKFKMREVMAAELGLAEIASA